MANSSSSQLNDDVCELSHNRVEKPDRAGAVTFTVTVAVAVAVPPEEEDGPHCCH